MPNEKARRGRYYEDYEVGGMYRSLLARTLTEVDNTWMTLATMDANRPRFDDRGGAGAVSGRLVANPGVILAIVLGLSSIDTSQKAFTDLGWDRIKLPLPVMMGDTLYEESQVLAKRESKSRPGGVVEVRTRGFNQDGGTVLLYEHSFFVYKRPATQAGPGPAPAAPAEEPAPDRRAGEERRRRAGATSPPPLTIWPPRSG